MSKGITLSLFFALILVFPVFIYYPTKVVARLLDWILRSKLLTVLLSILLIFPVFIYYPARLIAWGMDFIIRSNHSPADLLEMPELRQVRPFERLIARGLDMLLITILLTVGLWIHGLIGHPVSLKLPVFTMLVYYFVWMPIEAWMLSTWGTTPGKWFMKIKVVKTDGRKLSFAAAFKRSFLVLLLGMGAGNQTLALFEQAFWILRISEIRPAYWDRASEAMVVHEDIPVQRWAILFLPQLIVMAVVSLVTLIMAIIYTIRLIF